jgi:membrane protein YdbS with pleckstrin-like domain
MALAEGDIAATAWQPLPLRARRLFMLMGACIGVLPALPAFTVAQAFGWHPAWVTAACALLGAGFGAWRGARSWRHTHWSLDAAGFTLRRGHLWRSETRVPQSRVQHLDLRRGPLQRRYGLSTLVIHTAGTRQSAVSVRGLDEGDAERLRDTLARQADDD